MKRTIERSDKSDADIAEIYDYISDDNLMAAEEFLDAVEDAYDRLAEYAELGIKTKFRAPQLANIRAIRVSQQFSHYLVFYLPTDTAIRVLRVFRASRDIEQILSRCRENPA